MQRVRHIYVSYRLVDVGCCYRASGSVKTAPTLFCCGETSRNNSNSNSNGSQTLTANASTTRCTMCMGPFGERIVSRGKGIQRKNKEGGTASVLHRKNATECWRETSEKRESKTFPIAAKAATDLAADVAISARPTRRQQQDL